MPTLLPWVLLGLAAIGIITTIARRSARATVRRTLRATWGQPVQRDRDMSAIASYHLAIADDLEYAQTLDDRTWTDLNMDEVFAVLDRTQSATGRQLLYRRLRGGCAGRDRLLAFEALVERAGAEPAQREDIQVSLARLGDKAGYDLWWLAQPGLLHTKPWFVLFPIVAVLMVVSAIVAFVWPPALLLLVLGAFVSLGTRGYITSTLPYALGPLRQLGPLIAVADDLARLDLSGAEPIVGRLAEDVSRLSRLRRIAAWISRDTTNAFDLSSLVVEYLNMFLLLDANALFFGARELQARGAELLRTIDTVGEVDAAVSIASYRAGTAGWTRPAARATDDAVRPRTLGTPGTLADLRHPLVAHAVPNSVALMPPQGLIITGSNMSGKSTFLRTVGVAVVMAQTVNTCLASRYDLPELVVRSCIGRSDDLMTGKSYYIVEVESVLTLVKASQTSAAHLFLFDELFRGTNAVERIAAGEAVLAELLQASARHVVIAATHDRELVDLLRDQYAPFHFTDTVGPDGLVFDYRLEPGPATTRNAIALLELSGAPAGLVARALSRAAMLDAAREHVTTGQLAGSAGHQPRPSA